MRIGYGLLTIIGLILSSILLSVGAIKYLIKKKILNKKKKTLAMLMGINIIWLSIIGGMFVAISTSAPDVFIPNSCCPEIYIDSEDNAHIYFVSYIDYASRYNVAYVKFDSNGKIVDGPKFVDNESVNDHYEKSERKISDKFGNIYIINIEGYGLPQGNYNTTAYLLYSKIDSNGIPLIENKTIASHKKIGEGFGSHSPEIFETKLRLDSKNNLHIVWEVNRGPGNYFEVYYMKLDKNGNILVPQTRLYVFDYGKLAAFVGIFTVVPTLSFIYYLFKYKIKSRNRNEKNNTVENKKDGGKGRV